MLQVRSRGTTVRWSGASAPTASTCTASSNGSTPSRSSSSVRCAGRSGSLRNDCDHRWRRLAESRTPSAAAGQLWTWIVYRNVYVFISLWFALFVPLQQRWPIELVIKYFIFYEMLVPWFHKRFVRAFVQGLEEQVGGKGPTAILWSWFTIRLLRFHSSQQEIMAPLHTVYINVNNDKLLTLEILQK